MKRAKKEGCFLLQLTTDKRRPDAIRFYEKIGFVATHEGMKFFSMSYNTKYLYFIFKLFS
ncbi:hypothetical protein MUN82_21285 [Hymenobacter aerilatus]|uniref:GNAT family N-acetyltransferase n=1 Tax=Hymenobacter aerilatus TaxID=2932251 RepID=A0A8T9T3Z9_9BACT|nr:hypothetical protein MUN82_21285 [Hymenobacter aerilatus]